MARFLDNWHAIGSISAHVRCRNRLTGAEFAAKVQEVPILVRISQAGVGGLSDTNFRVRAYVRPPFLRGLIE